MKRSTHLGIYKKLSLFAGTFALLVPLTSTAFSEEDHHRDEVFKPTHVIQVPGAASFFSFDISFYDPVLNKYFLADRNNKTVDVIDGANAISQFPPQAYAGVNAGGNDFSGPDGLLTANNHTEVWVGDSPGKLWVLDSSSGALKTLPGAAPNPIIVGGTSRADELCYAPRDNVIMIASPAEGFVTFVSTKTYKVVGKLIFDGSSAAGHAPLNATNGLEQCQYSEKTGKFYQNVPEVSGPGNDTAPGAVAVINPVSMKVETSFPVPLDACAGPQGMTIGPHNQILLGCNAASPNGHRNIAVINLHSGALLGVLPDLGGADEVWYNDGDGHYFIPSCNTACRTVPRPGAVTGPEVLGVVDANGLRLDQTVTIATQNSDTVVTSGNPRTAHSVAVNSRTNEVYLPLPSTGGNAPQFGSSLCDARGTGITVSGNPSSVTGCIAILKAKNDDRPRIAQERDRDDRQE
jgi:hypothetical protein